MALSGRAQPLAPPAQAAQKTPSGPTGAHGLVTGGSDGSWRDPHRPVDARVEALLAQLHLDEKIALMAGHPGDHHATVPGVPRLGIPPLRFSDGPAGLRLPGAVAHPAPLALAASWDPELAAEYGSALGAESRAHGVNALLGPMVNIVRAYHAGRCAETFGEDPHLTARIAVPVVRGVQSRHVLAVAKHFALYNQETARLHLSAQVGERALHEIYLPAFEALVREARVGAVMAAYNKVAGTYVSEHVGLLVDELRGRMGFTGFVLSDWEATHGLAAVTAGLDMELPLARYYGEPLRAALLSGAVDAPIVDDRVRAILRSMFAVGLVDDPVVEPAATSTAISRATAGATPDEAGAVEATGTNETETDDAAEPVEGTGTSGAAEGTVTRGVSPCAAGAVEVDRWSATARRIAERGTVLLKNERQALPLDPATLRSVAVIGASAEPATQGFGGSAWVPGRRWVSALRGLTAALGERVDVRHVVAQPVPFLDTRPTVDITLLTPPPGAEPRGADAADADRAASSGVGVGAVAGTRHGLLAEYFANTDLAGPAAVTRIEERAQGNWHLARPHPTLPDRYSARWTARLQVPSTGRYTLGVEGFGPARLCLDGKPVADASSCGGMLCVGAGEVTLEHGRRYDLRVEYRHERGWLGGVRVFWEPPSRVRHPDIERAAAVAAECDAAVVVVGSFQAEGFDRPTLSLPGAQDALVDAVAAVNPRTIVVLATGGPVLLPWVDRVPAIVESWYGGEQAGAALAAVLTGTVNPSGRLPVSFPRSGREIPTLDARRFPGVDGRVDYSEDLLVGYRWYDATGNAALFPFGHGLSYTTFEFADLSVSPEPVTPRRPLTASVTVTNTGRRAGTEVVQVYVGSVHALDGPPRQLRAFRTVSLEPGETRRVEFTLPYRDFCRWSPEAGGWIAPAGQHRVLVGRSSADLRLRADVTVQPGAGPCAVSLDVPAEVNLGSGVTVSATVENLGPAAVTDLDVALELPDGWSAQSTAEPDTTVPGGTTVSASWRAKVPGRGYTGAVSLRAVARYTADGQAERSEESAALIVSYPRLAASFDNIGIDSGTLTGFGNPAGADGGDGGDSGDWADRGRADFCGTGAAYLGAALSRAGLLPGRTVTCGNLYFTWPRVEPGQPDNTVACGQRIPMSCAGRVLAFLGAASGGAATGVGTVTYADGTTHPYAVTVPDWLSNQPLPGSEVVATVEQYRAGDVLPRRSVSLYALSVPLLSGRAVSAFTLPVVTPPRYGTAPCIHVFGVSIC